MGVLDIGTATEKPRLSSSAATKYSPQLPMLMLGLSFISIPYFSVTLDLMIFAALKSVAVSSASKSSISSLDNR